MLVLAPEYSKLRTGNLLTLLEPAELPLPCAAKAGDALVLLPVSAASVVVGLNVTLVCDHAGAPARHTTAAEIANTRDRGTDGGKARRCIYDAMKLDAVLDGRCP